MDQRALPLPILRPITIGSDPRSGIQFSHGSIRPFHVQLTKKGRTVELRLLDRSGALQVEGRPVELASLHGGELIRIGELQLRIERGTIAPAVTATGGAVLSLEQEFYAHFRRELRRMPWLGVSLVVHLLLFLWADQMVWNEGNGLHSRYLLANVDERSSALLDPEDLDELKTPPEEPEIELELPDVVLNDPEEPDDLPFLEDLPISMVSMGDANRLGMGRGGSAPAGFGGQGIRLEGVTGPLKEHLRSYRSRGLDLVFLVDTTASMELFLRAAKRTVDRIITDLSALVPNTRLGIVAYRDEGDQYVTRATPISADRYAILNFLEGLEARGGGDVPEAILDALEFALDELPWRKDAHRVILIVADAPPHPEDMAKLRMRIRSATRSGKSSTVISTIFTGSGQLQPARQEMAESSLQEIARAGGGEFARMEDTSQVVTQLISMTMGSRFSKALRELLQMRADSSRQIVVRRMVEERNVDWLLRKLRIVPVESAVVEGLIHIGSPAVAMRCLDLLSDNKVHRQVQEAALYIIRRTTHYSGALDLSRSVQTQTAEWEEIKSALERAYRQQGNAERGG
ncbi:MAG: VWA domain-containing protein [Planctomycetota bacterium]